MQTIRLKPLLLLLGLSVAAPAWAEPAVTGGPLSSLGFPKEGRTRQISTWDKSGGNRDFVPIEAGQTITLAEHDGAGIVQRWWCTISPRAHPDVHRRLILRIYWDGSDTPSVEAPIGDFFGVGFGEQKDYQSLPLNQMTGGYNCYWPMPFADGMRWTLTNMSDTKVDAFYSNITFTTFDELPADMLRFHAQYRQERPVTPGQPYTVLDVEGEGYFVGTAMYMQSTRGRGLGFLEGDEKIYIDGEDEPSLYGTGTEDYFSGGWYYDRGEASTLYHGVNLKDSDRGRISTYRWHIEDAVTFDESILFEMEHGGSDNAQADYSSIAFYYLTEPTKLQPLPDAEALKPKGYEPPPVLKIEGAQEAEDQAAAAEASSGAVGTQGMHGFADDRWSANGQLLWAQADGPGATMTLTLTAPEAGRYTVTPHMTQSFDYATVQLSANGQPLGEPINLFGQPVKKVPVQPLGPVELEAGENTLTVEITGKDEESDGYLVGIDAFVIEKAE